MPKMFKLLAKIFVVLFGFVLFGLLMAWRSEMAGVGVRVAIAALAGAVQGLSIGLAIYWFAKAKRNKLSN